MAALCLVFVYVLILNVLYPDIGGQTVPDTSNEDMGLVLVTQVVCLADIGFRME